jgi:hypothetical protein
MAIKHGLPESMGSGAHTCSNVDPVSESRGKISSSRSEKFQLVRERMRFSQTGQQPMTSFAAFERMKHPLRLAIRLLTLLCVGEREHTTEEMKPVDHTESHIAGQEEVGGGLQLLFDYDYDYNESSSSYINEDNSSKIDSVSEV